MFAIIDLFAALDIPPLACIGEVIAKVGIFFAVELVSYPDLPLCRVLNFFQGEILAVFQLS